MTFRTRHIPILAACIIVTMGYMGMVQAQSIPVSIGGLELTASTDNPAPGETVTITAASYSADINSANITWKVNGVQAQKGTGSDTFSVAAPDLGKKLK